MSPKEIEQAAKEYTRKEIWQIHFIAGAEMVNERQPYCKEDMFLNMQYYMEYCLMKGYVTPHDWIEKYKHF